MIAAKWDRIWDKLSGTFADGLGHPYPPYARSSCAFWSTVDQDEAIVSGAITESEFTEHMAQLARSQLTDREGNAIPRERLLQIRRELEEEIYRSGGPPPGATRSERVAHERTRHAELFARIQKEYEKRNPRQR